MQTGIMSSDTFPKILREYAGKRKQGILEIQSLGRRYEITFSGGKIAFAECLLEDGSQSLTQTFLRTSLKTRFQFTPSDADASIDSLYEQWLDHHGEEPEHAHWKFRFLLKHAVLETLYSTLEHQNGHFQFRHEVVSDNHELLPALSVGQVLLDLVALEAGEFDELFEDEDLVVLKGEYLGTPTDEERVVLGVLEEGPVLYQELQAKSALSSFHFGSSVLTLIERDILCKTERTEYAENSTKPELPEVLAEDIEESLDINEELSLTESLYVWNMRLVYDNRVPGLMSLILLMLALAMPILLWQEAWQSFSDF